MIRAGDSRRSWKLNQRYLEDTIACEFTCRPVTTRTRRHVTPFAYMQDGQNLFFPQEAFRHEHWEIDETSQVLRAMRAIEDLIIVGVYSNERREEEYTKPGYEAYARSIVEELVPAEQLFLRTTNDPVDRSMWGSSLGGVVSFYSAWEYPARIRRRRLHVEHVLL